MSDITLSSNNFINRELSWLEFNDRCLRQTLDKENPLFERMKFLSIVCSNLDEFFMVRVASLRDQMNAKGNSTDPSGMSAKQQLVAIANRVSRMYDDMYEVYSEHILPELNKADIHILRADELDVSQQAYCEGFFDSALYPVLTPLAIDRSHPFPFIINKAINVAAMVEDGEDGDEVAFATVQVPSNFPRLFRISMNTYVPIEDIIRKNIDKLFPGFRVVDTMTYRMTRNGDMTLDEDAADDLLAEIKKSLKLRRSGAAIRLEIESGSDNRMKKYFAKCFDLEKREVYEMSGPLSLTFLLKELYSLGGYDAMRFKPYTPYVPQQIRNTKESIFEQIKQGDILMQHPYDSFEPVVRFLSQAADDENVIAIKQTLYRVSRHSPIIENLIRAAENGKQVTALVELKARFDEEHNITYGEELARKGVNVVYGVEKLKTHSKITMVVRKEPGGVRRYLHLGTGNYNDVTAGQYTDYGLLTANESLGDDATAFFNSITGFFRQPELRHLVMAPHTLRSTFYDLLAEQTDLAERGMGGFVLAKMNSLSDAPMIKRLYEAAQAGVKIRLLVRGICCLDPYCDDAAGNIEVHSIVGRFLEHTRVYIFGKGSDRKVYLASADWMTRNLSKRVELMFPLLDKAIADKAVEETELCWSDNVKTRIMGEGGIYTTVDSYTPPRRKTAVEGGIFDFGTEKESAVLSEEEVQVYETENAERINAQETLITRVRDKWAAEAAEEEEQEKD